MLWSSFLLALREIRRNLLRSALTMLGIVIGVAAVIVMVTIGGGATAQVTAQIESLGSNLLMVRPGQHLGMGLRSSARALTLDDVEAIRHQIGSISAVAPLSTQGTTVVYGNENWSTTLTGTDNGFLAVGNWSLAAGRAFTVSELRSGAAVCLLGQTVRKQLFGAQDPIGSKLRTKKLACQAIGVLESKGQSAMGMDRDDLVLVPLRTFWRRIAGNQDVHQIQVSATQSHATTKVKKDLELLMRERRHISAGEEDDFSVRDMTEIAQTLAGTTHILTALLGAVAAVSLLVGGIGIMNIMLVSVTERTREIGIRLAIGALEREVLLQFLVEAVALSSLGGLLGIGIALAGSFALARLLGVPFILDGGIILLAFLFSAAVGVIFGYFPARKAARLNPIEALRYE